MAEQTLFSSIPGAGLANLNWTVIGIWAFVIIVIVGTIWLFIFLLIFKAKTIKCYEIDMISHRIKTFTGQIKRDKKSQSNKLWLGKYKKFIPCPQQEDMYYTGKRDSIILLKDNNGLHHTLRPLKKEELVWFYKNLRNIDITKEFFDIPLKDGKKSRVVNPYYNYYQIYAMANPHEDLEFLGSQIEEANKEYHEDQPWWKSPTIMVIGTAFICFMMVVVTLLLRNKV